MVKTVAIVGRPNVGKSTLFNRLVRKRLALTHDTPGLTRDWHEGNAEFGDLSFRVIDTAGFEEGSGKDLESRMLIQTARVLDEADVALFLVDARKGLTPLDEHFANWLRKRNTPILLVANKCEGRAGMEGYYVAFQLGFGEPIAISAEHNEGTSELYRRILPFLDVENVDLQNADEPEDAAQAEGDLTFAIVGRPNVGKSTLANRLIGKDRLLTGPEAGITRDAIPVAWEYEGRNFHLVDTAGFRRAARIEEKVEQLSITATKKAIARAQIVLLVLDAEDLLEKQDLTIASLVIEEGRGLVIVINKWDRVKNAKAARTKLVERLERSLPQVRGLPWVELSAKTGENIAQLMPTVLTAYQIWNRRVSTAKLNQWLAEIVDQHPPPAVKGRRLRLRYLTQIKTRPPTFALFASRPEKLPESYVRYLMNGLRDAFGFEGTPLRIRLRKGDNPYA